MTGAEFSEVDFDLLADYVGGALDGTPDEAVVTALIEGHPTWRAAHRELTGGVAAVTAGLGSWGAEPEPMPADVVARLDGALASVSTSPTSSSFASADAGVAAADVSVTAASASGGARADLPADDSADGAARSSSLDGGAGAGGATGGGALMEPGSDGAAPARHLVAVPDDEDRPATGRKRTGRLKWAAPIGIAAGVIAFVGVGVQQLGGESADRATNSAAGSAAERNAPEAAATLALPAGPAQVGASGVDYNRESLNQVAAQAVAAAGDQQRNPAGSSAESRASGPGPGVMADPGRPLSRLVAQEALLACIDAISRENAAGPVTAQVVDYALFQGVPALVVQFTASNGTWVWATGADCGLRGSGADRLGFVKVG